MNAGRTPRVSVVMPCYRHEKYAAAAIESVRAQTLTDWELIAIDDCSPDTTYTVLERFADPQIRISRHAQNAGAHATINEGVSMARGEWVAILNSDDLFRPTRLEDLLAVAARTSADVIGTALEFVDARSEQLDDPMVAWFEKLKNHYLEHGSIRRTLLTGNVFITTSNMFFRRSFFEASGPFQDLRYTHDYEWLLRALSAGHRVHFEPSQATVAYRLHGSNTILEAPLKANQETFQILTRHIDLLLQDPNEDFYREYADHVRRIVGNIEYVYQRDFTAQSRVARELDKGIRRVKDFLPSRLRR